MALISSESITLMVNGTLQSEFFTMFWPTRFTYSVTTGSVTRCADFSISIEYCLPIPISPLTEYQLPRPRPPIVRVPMASTSSSLPFLMCGFRSSPGDGRTSVLAAVVAVASAFASGLAAGGLAGPVLSVPVLSAVVSAVPDVWLPPEAAAGVCASGVPACGVPAGAVAAGGVAAGGEDGCWAEDAPAAKTNSATAARATTPNWIRGRMEFSRGGCVPSGPDAAPHTLRRSMRLFGEPVLPLPVRPGRERTPHQVL